MFQLKSIVITSILFIAVSSCKKESAGTPMSGTNEVPGKLEDFVEYVIPKGDQSATNNPVTAVDVREWRFQVYFDSSAIYTIPGADQYDINKLSGFADNKSLHTAYSARFGWRWSDSRLRLFGFVHNAGEIQFKEISAIDIGKIYTCKIRVKEEQYIFTIEELTKTIALPRAATTPTAEGYMLYPYFGGNQVAPHEMRIWVKYL
jgi:hypothetical protein